MFDRQVGVAPRDRVDWEGTRAGKKLGTWKYWSPMGELQRREQYRDGKLIDTKEDAPPASRSGR
jgi:hypothetical protein